ncbi:MAG: NBR1-Ig-like domain-containing protein [Anaerolineae bacterium]
MQGNHSQDTILQTAAPIPAVTLVVRQGPEPGKRFFFRKKNISLGRLPDNDVAINDQQISRRHASLTWEEGHFVLRDLGSANGTFLNGEQVTSPKVVYDGDVIGLSEVLLAFRAGTGEVGEQTLAVPGSVRARRAAVSYWPFIAALVAIALVAAVAMSAISLSRPGAGPGVSGPCEPGLTFVADITVKPGEVVEPGKLIDKTWKVRNSGTCPWEAGYQLVFIEGDRMNGPETQPVPSTPPGEETRVGITLKAPWTLGEYKGVWRAKSPAGDYFGDKLTVSIKVEEEPFIPPPKPTLP